MLRPYVFGQKNSGSPARPPLFKVLYTLFKQVNYSTLPTKKEEVNAMNMTKNDLFNTCIANLSTEFDREQLDKIKINLLVTFSGYEVQAIKQLPSTEIHDNEFLFERFAIDTLAKGTKPSSIKTYMNMIKPFFDATGLNYTQVTAQD